jgi:alpha-beta hydrolase superfamily lysophospholipase
MQQYGLGSLDQDADDILLIAKWLHFKDNRLPWVLAGHSTGTQDAVRYTQRHGAHADGTPPLASVMLLAPVCTLLQHKKRRHGLTSLRACFAASFV